jgi:hypothetical protein
MRAGAAARSDAMREMPGLRPLLPERPPGRGASYAITADNVSEHGVRPIISR